MTLEELKIGGKNNICSGCGATIENTSCKYCGTKYNKKNYNLMNELLLQVKTINEIRQEMNLRDL